MHPVTSNGFREYAVWLLMLAIIVIAGRHAKQFIAFVLDQLYQLFIRNYPNTA